MSTDFVNKLYCGDNLEILRQYVAEESVDLIYLDPPFNSKADYNVLFKTTAGEASVAQAGAFKDTREWDEAAAEVHHLCPRQAPKHCIDGICFRPLVAPILEAKSYRIK